MDLIDYLFPGMYFKVLHEQYSGMGKTFRTVRDSFIKFFYENKLSIYSELTHNEGDPFIIIKSKSYKNYEQCVYISFYGTFLDVFHVVRFDKSFLKRTSEMKLEGEISLSEIVNRMGLLSWILSVRKTLEQSINEVKNNQ